MTENVNKNKHKGNDNAWRNEARKLFKLPVEEREAKLKAMNIGEKGMQKVYFIRERLAILEAEALAKTTEKPATIAAVVEIKTEEKPTVDVKTTVPVTEIMPAETNTDVRPEVTPEKIANPAIKAGIAEVKGLLSECEEITARLKEKNPTPEKKTENKTVPKPFSLKDRKPGDILWQYTPQEKKEERNGGKIMSERNDDSPLGVVVIRRERKDGKKKVRQLSSSVHKDKAEEIQQPVTEEASGMVEEPIFYTFDSLIGKAPDRSFIKELLDGSPAIGKRYKIEDQDGNIKRFRVLIPASVLGRECKQFPAKENRPPYTWRTIFVSGTTLRVNLNLRRNKDGTVLEPSPNENGDIVGEAEIGYNVSMKNGKIYAIQYMNVYAPNGATGDIYKVRADLSRGQQKPGDITVGPSIGTFLKSKQDQKTTDAEIILHLEKLNPTQ